MLRFAGMALASLAPLAMLTLDCAGFAGAAGAVRAAVCAPAPAAGSWVACVAQPHTMAASANTVFFMLLSFFVGRQRSIMAHIIFAQICIVGPHGTIHG